MASFTLNDMQVLAVSSLFHAASKDDVTPVLTGIHLHITPTELTASATDRYMVAELTFPLDAKLLQDIPDEGVSILVPRADMVQVARMRTEVMFSFAVPTDARQQTTSVMAQSSELHRTLTFPSIRGNFPPVARLFYGDSEDDIPSGVALNLGLIGRVVKLLLPGEKSAAGATLSPWVFKYKANLEATHQKFQPVMLERRNELGRYRVLIQPNLVTR